MMIMLMVMRMGGDYYWRKSIKKIDVSSYWALFSLASVKVFRLIHSGAFLEPNAGQWRLMHFYCSTSSKPPSKAQTDVSACGSPRGSDFRRLLDSEEHGNSTAWQRYYLSFEKGRESFHASFSDTFLPWFNFVCSAYPHWVFSLNLGFRSCDICETSLIL